MGNGCPAGFHLFIDNNWVSEKWGKECGTTPGRSLHVSSMLMGGFHGRILPVSFSIADRWGFLGGECQLRGTPLNTADGMIAATALEHDLTVVTRNVKDFAGLGVTVFNPWDAA